MSHHGDNNYSSSQRSQFTSQNSSASAPTSTGRNNSYANQSSSAHTSPSHQQHHNHNEVSTPTAHIQHKSSTASGELDQNLIDTLVKNGHKNVVDHLKNSTAKPRALRFTWSMKTTTSMEARLVVQEILKVSRVSYSAMA